MAIRDHDSHAHTVGDGSGDPLEGGRMTLIEHLTELRNRVVIAVVAVAIGGVAGFVLYNPVLSVLIDPYCDILPPDRACRLIITDPLEAFSIRIKMAAYVGLVLASPVVLWQIWRFVTPGLYPNEKRYAVPFVASAVVLFLLGAVLAFLTFPRALDFLVAMGGQQLETFYTPGRYIGLITFMMLAFGVAFQFPILLIFLQLAGILRPEQLAGFRRYAIVLIFIATAILTPSGDPFTLTALAIPLCLFYEGTILIGKLRLRRQRRRQRAAAR